MGKIDGFCVTVSKIQSRVINWFLDEAPRQFLWREIIFSKENTIQINEKAVNRNFFIFIAEFMLIRTKAEQIEPIYDELINIFPSFQAIMREIVFYFIKNPSNLPLLPFK